MKSMASVNMLLVELEDVVEECKESKGWRRRLVMSST